MFEYIKNGGEASQFPQGQTTDLRQKFLNIYILSTLIYTLVGCGG